MIYKYGLIVQNLTPLKTLERLLEAAVTAVALERWLLRGPHGSPYLALLLGSLCCVLRPTAI